MDVGCEGLGSRCAFLPWLVLPAVLLLCLWVELAPPSFLCLFPPSLRSPICACVGGGVRSLAGILLVVCLAADRGAESRPALASSSYQLVSGAESRSWRISSPTHARGASNRSGSPPEHAETRRVYSHTP